MAKNIHDARYVRTEHRIHRAINQVLKRRSFNLQVKEICKIAGVHVPTFYRHYHNVNDAIEQAESKLLKQFQTTLDHLQSTDATPIEIFNALLIFIYKNQAYFSAAIERYNFRLFHQLFSSFTPLVTADWSSYGTSSNQRILLTYYGAMIGVIVDWFHNSDHHATKIPFYASALTRITETFRLQAKNLAQN